MTQWTKTAPKEPGFYWFVPDQDGHDDGEEGQPIFCCPDEIDIADISDHGAGLRMYFDDDLKWIDPADVERLAYSVLWWPVKIEPPPLPL